MSAVTSWDHQCCGRNIIACKCVEGLGVVADVKHPSDAPAAEAGEGGGVVHVAQMGVVHDEGSKSPVAPSLVVW